MMTGLLFDRLTLLWLGAGAVLVCCYFFFKRLVIEFVVAFGDGGDAGASGADGGGGDQSVPPEPVTKPALNLL